jgi:hypothetical protein
MLFLHQLLILLNVGGAISTIKLIVHFNRRYRLMGPSAHRDISLQFEQATFILADHGRHYASDLQVLDSFCTPGAHLEAVRAHN